MELNKIHNINFLENTLPDKCAKYDHDTVKPETLTRALIMTCSRPNDLVVVPFAGSGTECAMAVKEGRKTIGFEITEKQIRLAYIELARQILYEAVISAPIESGQLRKSARATVGGRLVAKGTESGIQAIKPDALRPSDTLSISLAFGLELGTRGSPEIKRYRTHKRLKDGSVVCNN